MKFVVTPGQGLAAFSLLLHPSSSAATHPVIFVLVLEDSIAGHDIVYDLHWS